MITALIVKSVLGLIALLSSRRLYTTTVRKHGRDRRVRRTHTGMFAAQKAAVGRAAHKLNIALVLLSGALAVRWLYDNLVVVVIVLACAEALVLTVVSVRLAVWCHDMWLRGRPEHLAALRQSLQALPYL